MNSPALAIGYVLWLKARWLVGGMLLYILAMWLVIQFNLIADPENQVICSSLILVFAGAPLLNVLIFSPADLGAKGSVYPKHMLTLPMRTRALVGWPMFYGVAIQAVLWILLTCLVLRPSGIPAPIVCPIAILGALIASIQAIAWSPFPSPFFRVPMLVLAIVPIIALWVGVGYYPHNATAYAIGTAGTASLIAVAFAVGRFGLSLARRGSEFDLAQFFAQRLVALQGRRIDAAPKLREPFAAADGGLLWYALRRTIPPFPVLVGSMLFPLLVCICWQAIHPESSQGLMIGAAQVPTTALYLGILVLIPLFLSSMASAYFSKSDFWGPLELTSFFAVRPVTTTKMIVIKLKAAAIAALVVWAMMVLTVATWAAVETSPLNPGPSSIRQLLGQATLKDFAAGVCIAVGILALLWRNIVVGLWPILIGRKWISTTLGIVTVVAVTALPGVVHWISLEPKIKQFFLENARWGLTAIVALKLCAAVAVGIALRQRHLISMQSLAIAAFIWLTTVGAAIGLLAYFVPWSWYIVPAAILFAPLTRIGAAPLALAVNRTRQTGANGALKGITSRRVPQPI